MPIATLTFSSPINSSAQVGDIVYYTNPTSATGSAILQANTSIVTKFGPITDIRPGSSPEIDVVYDLSLVSPPGVGAYIMFEKDKQVNSSSLIGYYAEVELMNNSDAKIELFSLGSEVSENSK